MKKFKKIIVAIMAMALALGMLTMTASAADYTDGGKLYIAGSFNGWTFEEMTGKDGVYTIEAEVEAEDGTHAKVKFIRLTDAGRKFNPDAE